MNFLRSYIGLVLALLVSFFTTGSHAAEITVRTDRDPAVLNESFVMTFISDGDVDTEPDFRPLNRDFQVLSSGSSTNMSIVNGEISTTKSWTLDVIAKRTGTLTIPPISFGSDVSNASTIEVVATPPGSAALNDREIFLETEATPTDPYVQSEVVLNIRLFRSVATTNASLSDPPQVTGATAVVEKIGDDVSYDTRVGGKLFGVVERKYAIYPQGSGELTIEPIVFQGQISRGSSFFRSPFGRQARTVIIQSEPVKLNVQPVPDAFNGIHWLPARDITLTEEWSEYPLEFNIDEPLTRTLILTANGLTASQLPEFPDWQTIAFKQYPEQPALEDNKHNKGITGKRTEKIVLIPKEPGIYTLPEINIPWWNTVTGKMEYATLPERQITVTAPVSDQANDLPGISPPPVGDLDLPDIVIDPVPDNQKPSPAGGLEVGESVDKTTSRYWQWLSIFFFVAWIITLLMWLRSIRKRKHPDLNLEDNTAVKSIIKLLKQSCQENNPVNTKEYLLHWGKLTWPDRPPASIGDVATRCSETMATEIRLLNNTLYSKNSSDWQGKDLWETFEKEIKLLNRKTGRVKGNLEPLFKI